MKRGAPTPRKCHFAALCSLIKPAQFRACDKASSQGSHNREVSSLGQTCARRGGMGERDSIISGASFAWGSRIAQREQIRSLLASPYVGPVFVHGGPSTGKQTVLEASLPKSARVVRVDCVINHNDRLLFSAIACTPLSAEASEFVNYMASEGTTDSITVVILLRAERLKTSFSTKALTVLFNIAQLTNRDDLRIVLVSRVTWPNFRDSLALNLPKPMSVHFPPYTEGELRDALVALYTGPKRDCCVPRDVADSFYPGFAKLLVSTLSTVISDLGELQNISQDMFPTYLLPLQTEPVANGPDRAQQSLKLFNTIQAQLRHVLRTTYRREFVVSNQGLVTMAQIPQTPLDRVSDVFSKSEEYSVFVDLSETARCLLVAAFLASRNPPKHDTRYFTVERTRRPASRGTASKKRPRSSSRTSSFANQQGFSLERLQAIYRAIREDPEMPEQQEQSGTLGDDKDHTDSNGSSQVLSTSGQVQISNLLRLNLLTNDGGGDPLSDPKYRCNISISQAEALASAIHVDLHQYLHVDS